MDRQEKLMKHTSEEVVGNVGIIQPDLNRKAKAVALFNEMKRQSLVGYGRSSNEEVTLLCDGEPIMSHIPETTVTAFVGSAWYRDCGPFMSVAFNPKRFKFAHNAGLKLERLALQSAKDDYDGADYGDMTKRAFLDSVCTSGVSQETSVELTDEQRSDFYGKQGYCYFEGL